MKDEDVISFGDALTYKWKYIEIDPPFGLPILFNGKEVGGFTLKLDLFPPELNLEIVAMEGIELDPEYRGRGIGRMVVNMFVEQCDMLVGSITEDDAKPFWKAMGAEFYPIPYMSFPEPMRHTVGSKDPQFFWITKNPKAAAVAKSFAMILPELMKNFEKEQKEIEHANN